MENISIQVNGDGAIEQFALAGGEWFAPSADLEVQQ